MTRQVLNTEDIIDSIDVIKRVEELESEIEIAIEDGDDYDDLLDELTPLKKLAEQGEGYAADWHYGEALIRHDYFPSYAQDLAEEIGAYDPNTWPQTAIDWERAARELSVDYTVIDFDGVEYLVR